jgi:hypothetical protein
MKNLELESIRKQLKKYNLDLVEKEKELDRLVLKKVGDK